MTRWSTLLRLSLALSVVGLLAFAVFPPVGHGGDDELEPFQFADDFYRQNGINPDAIVDKLACGDPRTKCDESSPDPDRFSDVRIIETTGGFSHQGNLLYYIVPGKVMPNTFTDDAAGEAARQLADDSDAFLFPRADGNPISPATPNRRQDNIFDTRNAYFSGNPLGLWTITFISFDGPNVGTAGCLEELDKLAEDDGINLDGTPVIRTVSDIENLEADGCVLRRIRAKDGSQGFPWVI